MATFAVICLVVINNGIWIYIGYKNKELKFWQIFLLEFIAGLSVILIILWGYPLLTK